MQRADALCSQSIPCSKGPSGVGPLRSPGLTALVGRPPPRNGGTFSVPFWSQKGTTPRGDAALAAVRAPTPSAGSRFPGGHRPPKNQTSRLAYLAFFSINCRRGSTCSPMRMLKASSARSASSMVICTITRLSGFMVVSHSWSGFISPRPL